MKSSIRLAVTAFGLVFGAPTLASAHHDVDFDVYAGATLPGGVDATIENIEGNVHFDPALAYGGYLGYRLERDGFIFLSYSRAEPTAYFSSEGVTLGSRPVSFDFLQFGGNLETTKGRLTPYLGFSLGPTRVASGGLDKWHFSAVLDGGVKLELLSFLHLRLHGRVPFVFAAGEDQVLCVSGTSCTAALSGVPLVQAQLLLGLGVNF